MLPEAVRCGEPDTATLLSWLKSFGFKRTRVFTDSKPADGTPDLPANDKESSVPITAKQALLLSREDYSEEEKVGFRRWLNDEIRNRKWRPEKWQEVQMPKGRFNLDLADEVAKEYQICGWLVVIHDHGSLSLKAKFSDR